MSQEKGELEEGGGELRFIWKQVYGLKLLWANPRKGQFYLLDANWPLTGHEGKVLLQMQQCSGVGPFEVGDWTLRTLTSSVGKLTWRDELIALWILQR